MSTQKVAQRAPKSACNFAPSNEANMMGMNDRIKRLRKESFEAQPSLSIERALIETKFYKENEGKYPIPILRALNFYEICKQKTIYIGKDELIVGERGPRPKSVPTFPELTCHSVEDLHILNTRELQRYTISQEDIDTYEREVIPYWNGRTQRERIFNPERMEGSLRSRYVHRVYGTKSSRPYGSRRESISLRIIRLKRQNPKAYRITRLYE